MAKEQAFNWSETTFKEWHLGHYHKQMVNDYKGMIIRWMKSITGTDE